MIQNAKCQEKSEGRMLKCRGLVQKAMYFVVAGLNDRARSIKIARSALSLHSINKVEFENAMGVCDGRRQKGKHTAWDEAGVLLIARLPKRLPAKRLSLMCRTISLCCYLDEKRLRWKSKMRTVLCCRECWGRYRWYSTALGQCSKILLVRMVVTVLVWRFCLIYPPQKKVLQTYCFLGGRRARA